MSPPVAIVTGGASGIGLALVKHLVSLGWMVVVADIQRPDGPVPETLFVQTDISSWDQQVAMFKEAYAWGKRLDFCALNAGIDDRDDIFSTLSYDVQTPPIQPNTATFSVNITGTYYGLKLATHYMTVPSEEAGKANPGGKIVITASGGGIFPIPPIPQYTASKHALVGLVRALGKSKASIEANVRINAVCPAIVDTGALPPGLIEKLPTEQITPMKTILRCFNELADLANAGDKNWVTQGRVGETVEGNVRDLIWHHPPDPQTSKKGSFNREEGVLIVGEAYTARKRQLLEAE